MILKLFKSNTPIVLALLPLLLIGLWIPSLLSDELIEFNNETFLFNWINIEHPLLNRILAMAIVMFTAVQLNAQINNNEIFEKNTYIPALLYVIIISCIKDLQQLHPIIISNLFWVLAYRRLLNVYNQVQCKSEIFDASIFITLGALFNFPFGLIMFLFPWITLVIVRPFDYKEYLMPIFALLLISLYCLFYFYFFGDFNTVTINKSVFHNLQVEFNNTHYVLYGILVLIMYGGSYKLIQKTGKSSIRFRKITSNLIAFLALSLGVMVAEKFFSQSNAFVLQGSVSLAFLCSFYFYYAERQWLSSLAFYSFLAIAFFNNYWF